MGVWYTTTPNHGLTSLMLLSSSPSHLVLDHAVLAYSSFRNRIKYPVLVIPTPRTWISYIASVLKSAF